MTAWLKLVPSWVWWLLALVLVAGLQQYRVMDANGELSDARARKGWCIGIRSVLPLVYPLSLVVGRWTVLPLGRYVREEGLCRPPANAMPTHGPIIA